MSNLMRLKLLSASLTATLAATACTTLPAPQIARAAQLPVQATGPAAQTQALAPDEPASEMAASRAVLRHGSGSMINEHVAARPAPSLAGAATGSATFNFDPAK